MRKPLIIVSSLFILQWIIALAIQPYMFAYYSDPELGFGWLLFSSREDFGITTARIIASIILPVFPNLLLAILALSKKYKPGFYLCIPLYILFTAPALYSAVFQIEGLAVLSAIILVPNIINLALYVVYFIHTKKLAVVSSV